MAPGARSRNSELWWGFSQQVVQFVKYPQFSHFQLPLYSIPPWAVTFYNFVTFLSRVHAMNAVRM